jgi:hypothetical protein
MKQLNEKYTTDKILIFDIDDTIAISSAKIIVTDSKTGEKFELTPEEFNDYERNPRHILNFEQFKSLEIMKAGKLIDKYFNILKKNYKKGIAIGIITARDDQNMIYEWLRYHVGFHIDKHLIWAVHDPVHGLTGNIQDRKKSAMRYFIEKGYTDITFFDDDKNNIKLIKQLNREIDTVKITTHLAKK